MFRKLQTIKNVLIHITLLCSVMTKMSLLLTNSNSFQLPQVSVSFYGLFYYSLVQKYHCATLYYLDTVQIRRLASL